MHYLVMDDSFHFSCKFFFSYFFKKDMLSYYISFKLDFDIIDLNMDELFNLIFRRITMKFNTNVIIWRLYYFIDILQQSFLKKFIQLHFILLLDHTILSIFAKAKCWWRKMKRRIYFCEDFHLIWWRQEGSIEYELNNKTRSLSIK